MELEVMAVASVLFVQMAELLSGWHCCQSTVGEGYAEQLHDIVTVLPTVTFVHMGGATVTGSVEKFKKLKSHSYTIFP